MQRPRAWLATLVLVPALAACPSDDGATSAGETGGDGDMGCDLTVASSEGCLAPSPTAFEWDSPAQVSERCRWSVEPSQGVIGTPVVADLDGDGTTEIAFVSTDDHLRIISGQDCSEQLDVPAPFDDEPTLATADLDGDGVLELIGVTLGGEVVVADLEGQELARSDRGASVLGLEHWGGPSIANVDGEGPPEIVYGGLGLRLEGAALVELYRVDLWGNARGTATQLVDLDDDGRLELVGGEAIHDALDGTDVSPTEYPSDLDTLGGAIDFDRDDPGPELIRVAEGSGGPAELTVYDEATGSLRYGPYSWSPIGGGGGPPAAADVDGDGEAEIIVGAFDELIVVDRDCAASPLPAGCAREGIRWSTAIRDYTSGVTTPTAFDLNGDGAAEVLYRDECWFRIYDGRDGTVRFAASVTSNTRFEAPVVVDLDGGGGPAEVIVTANSAITDCEAESSLGLEPDEPFAGVIVFEDPTARWTAARPIWNQHTFTGEHVEDDGRVPDRATPHWLGQNLLRAQSRVADPAFDLRAEPSCEPGADATCDAEGRLDAAVCNAGAIATPSGVVGRFVESGTELELCEAIVEGGIEPGECARLSCVASSLAGRSSPVRLLIESPGGVDCSSLGKSIELGALTCAD